MTVYVYIGPNGASSSKSFPSGISNWVLTKMSIFGLLFTLCLGAAFAQSPNKPAATQSPINTQKQVSSSRNVNQSNNAAQNNRNPMANLQNQLFKMFQNTFTPGQSPNPSALTTTTGNTIGNKAPYSDPLTMLSLMLGGDFASQMALFSMMNNPALASSNNLPFAFALANDNSLLRLMAMNSMSQGRGQGMTGQQMNPLMMYGLSSSDLWPLMMASMQQTGQTTGRRGAMKENGSNSLANFMLMKGMGVL